MTDTKGGPVDDPGSAEFNRHKIKSANNKFFIDKKSPLPPEEIRNILLQDYSIYSIEFLQDNFDRIPRAFRADVIEYLSKALQEYGRNSLYGKKIQNFLTSISSSGDEIIRQIKAAIHPKSDAQRLKNAVQTKDKGEKTEDNPLKYWLDEENGVKFTGGNLYRITRTEKRESERLLLSAPLRILGAVKTDFEIKINYDFAGEVSSAPIRELVTHVSANMKSAGEVNKTLAEFLYHYVDDQKKTGKILIVHDPIYVENNQIHVSYNTSEIDAAKVLKALREFYPLAANQHAYISALGYNLIAPLSYFIRTNAPYGYLFPVRVSFGQPGGSKTTTDSIFILRGYAQDKDTGVLTNQQVATNFTFMKNMEISILPVLINDVEPDWLMKVSTVIKNSSENGIGGDRGNVDQSITRRQLKRAFNITTNEIVVPTDDAARARRYILEKYTIEHKNRQNKSAFSRLIQEIPLGFMFAIFRDIFERKPLDQVVSEIAQTGDGCGLVNYAIGLVNNLCDKYGVLRFPAYTTDSDDIPDSFQELVEWLQDQWARLNATDDFGRPVAPYPEISKSEIDVDEMGNFRVYWFTGTAYKKVQKKLNFPHRNVTTLFANYIESGHIQIAATNKFHKFNGVAGRAFALRVYQEGLP